MNFFGFGAPPEIEILLDGEEKRKTAEIKMEDGKKERHSLYYDGETVSGKVSITLRRASSKNEHHGIRIELIGQIEMFCDRGNPYTFLSLYKDLARPGELLQNQLFNFEFLKVSKPYESYTGGNCKLRYFIRVSIMKRLTDIVKERELVVHTLSQYPDLNSSIKMEVGIEDCLHIEFEYNRSKYHLKDVIVGKIYFLLVRIKIKHMELAIIKRETTGSGPNMINENETIAKYEIMDGAPVRGESIPIRLFLAGYDLTPTFRDVNRKFSVRYYLNLVLVDEDDRRYFKQQEIVLYRKVEKPKKTFQASLQQQYREMQNPNSQVYPSTSTANIAKTNGSKGPGEATASETAATPSSTSTETIANDQNKQEQAAAADDGKEMVQSMGAMTISNGNENSTIVEAESTDTSDMNQDQSACQELEERSGDLVHETSNGGSEGSRDGSEPLDHDENGNDNQSHGNKAAFSDVVLAAGLSRTLSGDDSDDEMPALTGSVCQVEIHNVSDELEVDAAPATGEKYENEKFTDGDGEGKCVGNVGKEE